MHGKADNPDETDGSQGSIEVANGVQVVVVLEAQQVVVNEWLKRSLKACHVEAEDSAVEVANLFGVVEDPVQVNFIFTNWLMIWNNE